MDYIIGVDIGTTSTKTIAFDLKGKVLLKKNVGYPLINTIPTYSEQDPEEILRAVLEGIKHVYQHNENNVLKGVGFSSAMHSVIAVDKKGNPLTPSIIWADTRSEAYANQIKKSDIGHQIYMNTGTPIHPMSPLCKLCWIKDHLPDIFNKTHKFISIKEYIFLKLFNEYVIDHSIASATGLFNIKTFDWNKVSLDLVGITADKLSKPVPTTYILDHMEKEYKELIGFKEKVAFVVGGSDGCLANLGVNAIKPGAAAITIGTSGAIRVISDKPNSDHKERIFSYILTKDHFVLGGAINNGGIILRWFRDNFSKEIINAAKEQGADAYDLMMDFIEDIKIGSEGLIFLPYLLGERAPHWDANSKGVFFGINIKHTKEHFLRALVEGIVFNIYSVGRALEETTGEIDVIYATGGFVRSKIWLQMVADVFDKKVAISESYESSCLGAAVLAMKALHIIQNIEEVENFISVSNYIYPNQENHILYMKNYNLFARLYYKLKDEFVEISKLQ